ncbi:MAG: copper resistance protein CopC, partial [Anaerolineae bacterium]|nr:copper resistance protein CopC [Anaerolineae bacterium]
MIKRTLTAALFLLFFFLLSDVPSSESHGYIVRSIPSDRTVVTRAPNKVQVWFSEGLEPQFSTIEVVNQRGSKVDSGDGGTDAQNSAKLVVSLPSDLPQGVYLVKLRPVFSSDGHAVEDTLVFWIGERVGDFNESGSGNTAVTLEAVWRILLTLALVVLQGTFLMYALVLRPAWGNLPPRVMRRLSLLVWSSLITAILVNGLALIQMTLTLFDDIFQGNALSIVLQGTNFGDVWQIRMVLLVSILGIQIVAAQQSRNRPGSTHILWLVNGILAFLTLGTMSFISHASGSPVWPLVSLLMDYLHLSAVASWVGGLMVLALILRPALTPLLPEKRGQALLTLLKRFSRLALVCVSLIIATGIYAASINTYQV